MTLIMKWHCNSCGDWTTDMPGDGARKQMPDGWTHPREQHADGRYTNHLDKHLCPACVYKKASDL